MFKTTGHEDMCGDAPVSRYQPGMLPDDEGPALALWRVACREAMSHAGVGAGHQG